MAIIGNKATAFGDVILIRSSIPIIGLIYLSDYIDDVVGVTGTRFWSKEFRFSTNDYDFSSWMELTQENLQSVDVQTVTNIIFEYRYQRLGSDNTGDLEWNETVVQSEILLPANTQAFNQSIFAQFFDQTDTELLAWCINVTEKLYRQGIVPKYIVRERDLTADQDYISFWRAIAVFFGYIVRYAREFEKFDQNPSLLAEFLTQRGLFVNSDISDVDLQYLTSHFFDEIRQRGTMNIAIKKGIGNKQVDGELLRLIRFQVDIDEFILHNSAFQHVGWNMGNCSPCYRGTTHLLGVSKGYDESKDFSTLDKLPLLQSDKCSIHTDGDKIVLRVINVVSGAAGIGTTTNDIKAFIIDPNISYEITCWIKISSTDDHSGISLGAVCFDIDGNVKNLKLAWDGSDAGSPSLFFDASNPKRDDKYYFLKGIIYRHNYIKPSHAISSDYILDIGYGDQLQFDDDTTVKIVPYIVIDNTASIAETNSLMIWDLKIRPLLTPYSKGFIQVSNFIETWMKNNNGNITEGDINENMRRYLMPYNCNFNNIFIKTNNYL